MFKLFLDFFFYLISSPDSCHGNNPGFREDVKALKTPARWQPRVVCTLWAWLNDTARCCDCLWDGNQLLPPMAVPVPPFGIVCRIFLIFIAQKSCRKGSLLFFRAGCFSVLSLPEYDKVWLLPLPQLGLSGCWESVPNLGRFPLLCSWSIAACCLCRSLPRAPVGAAEQTCFLWAWVFFLHSFLVVQMCFW